MFVSRDPSMFRDPFVPPARRPAFRPATAGQPPLSPLSPLCPEPLESRRLLSAAVNGFSFQPLATIGGSRDAAPGGGTFVNDFEPYGLTDNGVAAFAADVSTGGEGVFLGSQGGPGTLRQVIRAGQPAPGGGTFGGFGVFGPLDVNVHGDVAFGFGLEPFQKPLGVNAGVFLYRHKPGAAGQVVQPGDVVMRPGDKAPGGGTFAGAGFHAAVNDFRDVAFAGTVRGADIDPTAGPGVDGLGVGVFLRDRHGKLSKVVRPGDKAP